MPGKEGGVFLCSKVAGVSTPECFMDEFERVYLAHRGRRYLLAGLLFCLLLTACEAPLDPVSPLTQIGVQAAVISVDRTPRAKILPVQVLSSFSTLASFPGGLMQLSI